MLPHFGNKPARISLEFESRSAPRIEGSRAFELTQLPADGPPMVLVRSLAKMLPFTDRPLPKFSIMAMGVDDTG